MRGFEAGRFSVITSLILSVGLVNHVIILPVVLGTAGRDAWISVLLAGALMLFLLLPLATVLRDLGLQPFSAWLKEKGGSFSKLLILVIVGGYLLLESAVTTVDVLTWTNSTYLPDTPPLVTSTVFMLLCIAVVLVGMQAIVYMSCIVLPVVSGLGVFVASGNANRKDYAQLLPLVEHGWGPVLRGVVVSGSGLTEIILFMLLQTYANKPFRPVHLYGSGLFIIMLSLGPTVAAICEFGVFESGIMRFPAFSQWRILRVGRYIEHLDFFAIYQWVSGALIRTSLALCILLELSGIQKRKGKLIALIVIGILLVALTVYPFGDSNQYLFYKAIRPFAFVTQLGLLLYVWALALRKRREGGRLHANGA
ncbi:spore germination protein (amino acid permease) [Cohnella sp. OV330]|uniref:endospore germination permease n=1 Tax=Cohnella sp. OV330 TaxID=1855288 RepID=UPI0008F1646F|nr:endospore germination permease [Cohnella sp. OV330]SFB15240.1 spore germination protein (amino acid permease) [Cohnella sp. OV330]